MRCRGRWGKFRLRLIQFLPEKEDAVRNRCVKRIRMLACCACAAAAVPVCAALYPLPGDYALIWRTRGLFAEFSPFVNPSLMAAERYSSLRLMASSFRSDSTGYEIAAAFPLGAWNTVGAQWLINDWKTVGEDDRSLPQQTAAPDTAKNAVRARQAGLAYCFDLLNITAVGVTVNLAYENRLSQGWEYGAGIDAGVSGTVLRSQRIGQVRIGAGLSNILQPDLGPYGRYPFNARFSLLAEFWERRIRGYGDVVFKDVAGRGNEIRQTGGRNWRTDMKLSVEAVPQTRFAAGMGFTSSAFDYWSLAASFDMPVLTGDRDLTIGYQFHKEPGYETYGQSVFGRIEFGQERASLRVMVAQAMNFYNEGKWADAYFAFGHLIAVFPYYGRAAEVRYMMGECAERMHLPRFAEYEYSAVTAQYGQSPAAGRSQLRLVALACKAGDTVMAAREYAELKRCCAGDGRMEDADYVTGQMYMNMERWDDALSCFERIGAGHPRYPFAQYSAGVALWRLERADESLERFRNCALHKDATAESELIADRACLMLAAYWFDRAAESDSALAKSVAVLAPVHPASPLYPYALLLRSWAACKAGKWSECAGLSAELLRIHERERHPALAEAFLLNGYSLLMQKKYGAAADLLERRYRNYATAAPADSSLHGEALAVDTLSELVEEQSSAVRTLAFSKGRQRTEKKVAGYVRLLDAYGTAVTDHKRTMEDVRLQRSLLLPAEETAQQIGYVAAKAAFYEKGGRR